MATNIGTATLDFGADPGSNEASVAVTGQAAISGTSKAEVFVMADDSTGDHTTDDHRYLPALCSFTVGQVVAATGFTVYARSIHKLTGQWAIRWIWAD